MTDPDRTPAIAVTGLHKRFGKRPVLRQIDLTVPTGQLLGLVGPNGAGKSTLLRTLIGLVPYDGGSVRALGREPRHDSLAIRRECCYLPGEAGVYLQMTGEQFLAFSHGFYARLDSERIEALRTIFALPLQQKVRSYSAGMKQKLALLGCLGPDVPLYLLDEPDRALDASVRFALRTVLQRMRAQGKTIVLSSHHLGEVETLADRLVFLLDGSIVPEAVVQRARATLRQRPRIRMQPGTALPAGARLIQHEGDGTLLVETDGDPMQWLRQTPPGSIDSAEVGIPRLEDLYQLLLQEQAAGGKS